MDHCEKEKRKANPRERANILSLLSFSYTLGLFKKGLRKELEEEDLYEVIKNCRSKKCGDKTEKQWLKYRSIYKLLWTRFGTRYVTLCLITIAWTEVNSILQPYGMSRLISYFEKNQTKITRTDAYYCAGIVVFLKVFSFVFQQNFLIYETMLGIQICASLRSLLYRKALTLSPTAFSGTSLGNIVTMLTKDVNDVEHNLWVVKELTIFIIQSLTVSYLIWTRLGNAAFIGLGLMLLALPIQMYLSNLITKMRLKIGKNSDDRIQATQETLSAIKIIKMYTWENFFFQKISESRNTEIITIMRAFYIYCLTAAIGIINSQITFLVLILAYIWMGYTTSTEMIFYVYGLFQQLRLALGIFIPLNMSNAARFRAAFIRLDRFLQSDETNIASGDFKGNSFVELKDVAVKMADKELLRNVSLKVDAKGLSVVTGAVGSGKSVLLKTMMQDFPASKGEVKVHGSVSYASQDPWIFPSSIKQNILFGEKYDATRYKEVVRVCALKYDFSIFDNGDETIVADRGLNLSKGQQSRINLARAVYKKCDIYLLDDSLAALDRHVQDFIFKECIEGFLKDKICILVTQNSKHLEKANNVVVLENGSIFCSGKAEDLYKRKVNGFSIAKNDENDEDNKEPCEKFVDKHSKELLQTEQQESRRNIYQEVKKVGKVDLSVYKKYFQFGGGFVVFSFILLLYTISQTCESFSDKLLTKWVDLQQKVLNLGSNSTTNTTYYEEAVDKKNYTFNAYAILIVLGAAMGLVKYYALSRFCRNASINIHRIMSCTVIYAVMTFFDTHFLGNILNRFSLDLSNIDESIPFIFPGLFRVFFSSIGSVILISSVNWLFLIPACCFFIILIFMRMGYIRTSRSLKRLEAATRSPLVGHINASLEGLTTIRAFKAEQILKDEFDRHQDLYTSALFTLRCSTAAFGFFMDAAGTILVVLVVARFLFFDIDISAGNVGLAMTQVFRLTDFVEWGIKQWAELENHMTSVERALEYTEIVQESKAGDILKSWPSHGAIAFENVTLSYENSKDSVLRNISFKVKSTQKIGIVGRTGAGKSSIISVLFRLYQYEGKIDVDGVDISKLSLNFLRNSIAIIPQDPVMFTGTIRDNIDPYRKYSDEKIWRTIEKVKLKDMIPSLDMQIRENGANFSAGQKQLVCLARAAIGKYKIIVLDEATANMDPVTDSMLHAIIDEIFANCTVLTIAHRLQYISDCDMVIVMDRGELVEIDNPKTLLKDNSSVFYKMCEEFKTKRDL